MHTTGLKLSLGAESAADLMRSPVPSIPNQMTFSDCVAFFIDHNLTVAPVMGDRGEPVGVLSIADLLIHVRESGDTDQIAPATAARLMTPTVFSIPPSAPAAEVVEDMLRSKVHHLFVIDSNGVIMGVVSACDVVRHLRPTEW